MDMLCSKSVSLWKVSFLALLAKLALPDRSFLGDRDFERASASGREHYRELTRLAAGMSAAGWSGHMSLEGYLGV
jgi:hypothetical protein